MAGRTRSNGAGAWAGPGATGYRKVGRRATMRMWIGIQRRAEEVLNGVPDWLWDGRSLPVPVEVIADSHFGLLIRDVDDLTRAPGVPDELKATELSGLLLPDRKEVWVNRTEALQWPPRRRFTIGHELGHWCLHRLQGETVYCRAHAVAKGLEAPPFSYPGKADVFAAALLHADKPGEGALRPQCRFLGVVRRRVAELLGPAHGQASAFGDAEVGPPGSPWACGCNRPPSSRLLKKVLGPPEGRKPFDSSDQATEAISVIETQAV